MCVEPIYLRKRNAFVPCGRCGNCLKRSISDYTCRCKVEYKNSLASFFVTLTYEKDPLQLYKKDLQSFFKRLRKVGAKFSYFALGDYGDTFGRPHYHVLFFVKGYFPAEYLRSLWVSGDQTRKRGIVDCRPLSEGRISYTVRYGYLAKVDWKESRWNKGGNAKPFFLMSRRPALGSQYLTPQMRRFHISNDYWYFPDGKWKKPLPRYWRDKIYSSVHKRELHSAEYKLKSAIDIDREISRLGASVYYQRIRHEADSYLQGLRDQKALKVKIL